MSKLMKNYKNNLIVLFICYILTILFNLQLFTLGKISHILYGISMFVLCVLTLYCLILVNNNSILSAKIAAVIGPIMTLMSFIDAFNSTNGFIQNFRVTGWFFMIGGILIFNTARKIKKENLEN